MSEEQIEVEDTAPAIIEAWSPQEFRELVFEADQPVIVDFWASWCQPCIRMAPVFEAMAEKYPAVRFVKVDTDRASEIARLMKVKGLPTFALIWKGDVRDVFVGAQTPKQLEKHITRLIAISEGKGLLKRLFGG